jgi:hypothetical protein
MLRFPVSNFYSKPALIICAAIGKREVCMVAVEEHLRKVKENGRRREEGVGVKQLVGAAQSDQ